MPEIEPSSNLPSSTSPVVTAVMGYVLALLFVAAAVGLRVVLTRWLGPGSGFLLLLPAVLLAAIYGGTGPALLATLAGTIAADFLFLSPHSFFHNTSEENAKIILFIIISLGLTALAAARRRVAMKLSRSEAELRLAHIDLEARIVTRTHELAGINQALVDEIAVREHAQSELRRISVQSRCILWTSSVIGEPGWREDLDGTQRKLKWDVRMIDETAARQIVPIAAIPGESYAETLACRRDKDDDAEMARAAAQAFIAGKTSYCQEYRFTADNGDVGWLFEDVHVKPAGPDRWNATGIVTDVTARKRDQIERHRAETELRNISAQARCLIWYGAIEAMPGWDDPNFTGERFKWFLRMQDEQAAQRVVPIDVPTGGSYANAWCARRSSEDGARMDKTSQSAFLSGAPAYSQEFRCRNRFEKEQWLLEVVSLESRGPGKWYAVGVCTDITERKEAEEQRALMLQEQAARAHAEAASRAKDQFLAVLSHELRTPLTAVLMTASALEEDPQVPADLRSSVSMIRRNAELEARLIDDLLDSNRIAAGKVELNLELLDAHVILQRAAEVCLGDLDSKRQQLAWDLKATRHFVRGDVVRLQQVFWNLIRNAVKFTPAGGRILVRTEDGAGRTLEGNGRASPICAPQSLVPSPQSSSLTVSVTDNGIGIEPSVLPQVFQAFEQGGRDVTRQFGGLGLGLAISKALVELHGGTISAQSPGRGQGATFNVTLGTLPAPAPAPSAKTPGPRSASGTPGLRILLVEDHVDTQRATARFLRSLGHNVFGAGCAADARKAAAGGTFDLVISDLGLPDGSGLDLMRMLKTECHLRGIALSGYGMEEDIRNSRDAGFDYHLTKPVPAQQLEALLQQMASQVEG